MDSGPSSRRLAPPSRPSTPCARLDPPAQLLKALRAKLAAHQNPITKEQRRRHLISRFSERQPLRRERHARHAHLERGPLPRDLTLGAPRIGRCRDRYVGVLAGEIASRLVQLRE